MHPDNLPEARVVNCRDASVDTQIQKRAWENRGGNKICESLESKAVGL